MSGISLAKEDSYCDNYHYTGRHCEEFISAGNTLALLNLNRIKAHRKPQPELGLLHVCVHGHVPLAPPNQGDVKNLNLFI